MYNTRLLDFTTRLLRTNSKVIVTEVMNFLAFYKHLKVHNYAFSHRKSYYGQFIIDYRLAL